MSQNSILGIISSFDCQANYFAATNQLQDASNWQKPLNERSWFCNNLSLLPGIFLLLLVLGQNAKIGNCCLVRHGILPKQ